MTSPRVTVIIPTYNRSTVLPFAINSVLGQTFSDFELLVIGDGCTDDSEQVVAAIKDPRLRWINLSANSGHQSAPNNRGLQEARGEFIAYLGHDDLWLRHHLECSIGRLEETAADISHTLLLQVRSDGNIGLPILPKPEIGVGGAPSCRVHRHRIFQKIGGWNDYRTLHNTPEMDFFARAQAAGFSAVFVPRLTAIKFPASLRKGVYRQRSSHEQDDWSQRMNANADFEVENLARLVEVMARSLAQEMPIRKLVATFTDEIIKRAKARLLRSVKGAEIDKIKKYKGL
jgi:hypothetical protein